MLSAFVLGEGLPSGNVSPSAPRFTFWADPVAFTRSPRRSTPTSTTTDPGRSVPGSSGYPRPTKHLSGSSEPSVCLWILLGASALGLYTLISKRSDRKSLGSSRNDKKRIADEIRQWDRLRMTQGRPKARQPIWFVDPETGDLIELDYKTASFNGYGLKGSKRQRR